MEESRGGGACARCSTISTGCRKSSRVISSAGPTEGMNDASRAVNVSVKVFTDQADA